MWTCTEHVLSHTPTCKPLTSEELQGIQITGGKGPSSGKIAKVTVFGRWLVRCKLRFFDLLVLEKGVIPAVAVPPRARERVFIAQMGRKSMISGVMHG